MPRRSARQPKRRSPAPSRRPGRTRGRSARRKSWLAGGIAALTVLLAAGIGAAWWIAEGRRVAVDANTFCPTDRPPPTVVAVLIDGSDPLTPVQTRLLRQEITDLRARIPRYGALEIYRVGTTDTGVREPMFRACNPGRPNEIEAWRESPLQARQRWQQGFVGPLERVLQEVVPDGSARRSPIIESLQSVAVTAFGSAQLDGAEKTLLIASDMLQHTDRLSHYRDVRTFDQLRAAPDYANLTADLTGVDVEILYIQRADAKQQGRSHTMFWQSYFADQGAVVARVLPLAG